MKKTSEKVLEIIQMQNSQALHGISTTNSFINEATL